MARSLLTTIKNFSERFLTTISHRRPSPNMHRRRLVCEPLEDRRLLSIDLVSCTAGPVSVSGNGNSQDASISADGRYVAFESAATNLVDGDTNGTPDVFVKDLSTGSITRASTNVSGNQGNDASDNPSISANGRYVTFRSRATNLVIGDTNSRTDVFVKDLNTGAVTLVSINSVGQQGDNDSYSPRISPDGGWVTFASYAKNLGSNPDGIPQIFAKHLYGFGEIKLVSADSSGNQGDNTSSPGSISQGGHYVTFSSWATNLVVGDTNGTEDIFVKDLVTNGITRVNTDSLGSQGNGICEAPRITPDGRYVVFWSEATNLVPNDANGTTRDICVKDLQTGAIRLANTNSAGHQSSAIGILANHPSISADGRYVAFENWDSILVSGDNNARTDVFVKDLQTGTTTRVSLSSSRKQANGDCDFPVISNNGRMLAFVSGATNLVANKKSTTADVFHVSLGLPTVSIEDATPVVEGNLGTTSASFNVSLSTPSDRAVTVQYATSNGTAKGGKDYTIARGTVTFAPYEASKTITVLVKGDTIDEYDETFQVTLNNPKGATIARRTATGTIQDDDDPPAIAINDITVTEGRATKFTVTLSAASSKTVKVHYATADQTANVGSDYRMIPDKLLTFFPGQTWKTVTVITINDKVHEDPETFLLSLFNPDNGTLPRAAGICTILDNDPAPKTTLPSASGDGHSSAAVGDQALAMFLDAAARQIGTDDSAEAFAPAVDEAIRLLMLTSQP